MKNSLNLALAALLFCSASASAADAKPSEPSDHRYAAVDKALDDLALRINEVKKCVDYMETLQSELNSKKEEVAGDNGGVVPAAYKDAFSLKNTRIMKVNASCLKLDLDQTLYVQARILLHSVQPSNSAGIPKRRERFTALVSLSNSIVKHLHTPGSAKHPR